MSLQPVRQTLWIGVALLVAGCSSDSSKSEPTAPQVPDQTSNAVSASGAEIIRVKSRGPSAQLFFFQDDGGSAILGHLQVSRVETRTDRQTLLFYSVQRCDPSGVCQVLEAGFGLIPNRDLVLSNGELKLQTNTREEANQEFQREVGSGGAIRLEWTPVSGSVTDFHSHSRTRVSRLVLTHSHVVGSLSSALAEGRVLGFAIDAGNSNALVGTQREGTISIFKPELVP